MKARLRYRLGRWLLMPLLRREMLLAHAQLEAHSEVGPKCDPRLERYWMGRFTAIDRITRQLRITAEERNG